MPFKLRIKCSASMENLADVVSKVLLTAENCGLNNKRTGELELAFEEALVNVFNYAYPGTTGNIEIIAHNDKKNRFIVQIIDDGKPFDPLTAPEPDLDKDIADRQIGGLGIFLIKKLMDDVKYRREKNRNILELIVNPENT